MDGSGPLRDKSNRCLLGLGCGEQSGGLWVAKVLLLLAISVRRSNESKEYAFSQYTKVPRLTDTVEETLCFLSLRWSTDHEVNDSLRRATGVQEYGDVSFGKQFKMECLAPLQVCANMVRPDHAIVPFFEKRMAISAFLSEDLLPRVWGILSKCVLTNLRSTIRMDLWTCGTIESTIPVYVDRMTLFCVNKGTSVWEE